MHNCKYCKKEFDSRRAYEAHLPCPQRLRSYKEDEAKRDVVQRDVDSNPVSTPDFGRSDPSPDFSNVDSGSSFSGGGGESAGGGASGDF